MRNVICTTLLGMVLGATPGLAESNSAPSAGRGPDGSPRIHHPQYVAPTGVRKPPGKPLDDRKGQTPILEHHEKEIKDHTLKSICKGAPGCEGGHLRK